MGAAAGSLMCGPGDFKYSDNKIKDEYSATLRIRTDLMVPSAIKAGSAWERAAKISWDLSQDIKITVSLFKTDMDLSSFNKPSISTNFKIMHAKQLLFELRDRKKIDHRIRKNPGNLRGQKGQTRYSIRKIIQKKNLNKSKSEGSIKPSLQGCSLETYDLILPPWSDTWRLKCAVAQKSGIPARDQFLLCSNMTAESALEHNDPAASLSDLPVYSEQPKKPKLKHYYTSSSNIYGEKMSNTNRVATSTSTPRSTHLDLVICVPRFPRWQMNYEKAPSTDCSDMSSNTKASFCLTPSPTDRSQQELQSIMHLNSTRPSCDRTSENEPQVQPKNFEMLNSGNMPKKEPSGVLEVLFPNCLGQCVAASIEDIPLKDRSGYKDERVER